MGFLGRHEKVNAYRVFEKGLINPYYLQVPYLSIASYLS
jgi:hypothetical protein